VIGSAGHGTSGTDSGQGRGQGFSAVSCTAPVTSARLAYFVVILTGAGQYSMGH